MEKSLLKKLEKLILVLLAIFAGYIVFYNLGNSYLENWDEAWYGDIIRNMMQQKDFIVPHWNKLVLLDKPPLFMWVGSFFSSIFGLSEFSIRLPSAISAFVIIIFTTIYCYRKYGLIPSLLAFSSLALNNIFIWRARTGNIDALVSLQIFFVYFLILSKKKYKYLVLGILFALIYLTKASLVFFPFGIFIIHEFFFERKNIKKNFKKYFVLMMVFVLLSGFWLFLGSLKEGKGFIEYYLFKSDQGAASFNLSKFNFHYISYIYYSLQRRFFWVFLFGLLFSILKIKKAENLLLILFSSLLTILLGFGKKDNNWYLLPSMPFWTVLIGFGTYKFINFFEKYKKIKYMVILGVMTVSFYVSYKTYTVNIKSIMTSQTTANQAKMSILVNKSSDENDQVARLDHLYPTTIYYSNRFVYASPSDAASGSFFISRVDLIEKINKQEIKWVLGKKNEVEEFSKNFPVTNWQIFATQEDESVLKIN